MKLKRAILLSINWDQVTYMCQYTRAELFQIMACRCPAPSHYLKQFWFIVIWTLKNKLQWNFNQITTLFIKENEFENDVCKMVAILLRHQFSIHSSNRWKSQFVMIYFLNFRSLQFFYTCHENGFFNVWVFCGDNFFTSWMGGKWNFLRIWIKKCWWNGPLVHKSCRSG